ncbi:immunodominant staphylococcal antigen IsaB family protein [Abyssicoccus albus]|uniref:immunodominant staphylococcal antigen IsaB family protein n=1 Tax=Abyssicoccus albus TaxID=1817405 RepID=UPI0038B2BC9D
MYQKKFLNLYLDSSLVLCFSATPELFNATQAHVEEYVKSYFNYRDNTAHQSNFVLDKKFNTSLKADNFKINNYKITKNIS